LDEVQARVTKALQEVEEAVNALKEAEHETHRLESEIERTREIVAGLRTEQARLRKLARLRALTAYKGGTVSIDELVAIDSTVMDAARRATLLDTVNAQGNEAIDRLEVVTSDLKTREKRLSKQLETQRRALEDLEEREAAATQALERARAEEEALRRKLEEERRIAELNAILAKARAEARERAGVPSGGGGGEPGQIIADGDWVCPVQGPVSFRNDWGDPRSGGRSHKGTDMFAANGTPTVAVVGGSVFFQGDPLGGNAAYVNGEDGNTYYYAHLDDYVGGARSVSAGEVIGHVGSSGNADGGAPHLHFEIRVGGPNGTRVNPYPTLASHC
jgi:murein DD-endopeptidase MepM/ murein hydrolase activator NlpD